MMPSSTLNSNLPSTGSIWFQETPARMVLNLASTSLGHIGFIYSRLVALLLSSSPASIRNGLPSTMSWGAVPRFCKRGVSDAEAVETRLATRAREYTRVEQNKERSFMMISYSYRYRYNFTRWIACSPNMMRTTLPDWLTGGSDEKLESSPPRKCVVTHLPFLSYRPAACSARPAIGGPGVSGVKVRNRLLPASRYSSGPSVMNRP